MSGGFRTKVGQTGSADLAGRKGVRTFLTARGSGYNRPVSVYRPGEMPMQSCGQSVSAPRGEAGVRLNAHTKLRAECQRSARKAIYRNRPIITTPPQLQLAVEVVQLRVGEVANQRPGRRVSENKHFTQIKA